jgi:hypothetical protein
VVNGLWSDSHIGCFTPRRKRPRFFHRVGGWLRPIAGLNILEIPLPCLKSYPTSSLFQHVASNWVVQPAAFAIKKKIIVRNKVSESIGLSLEWQPGLWGHYTRVYPADKKQVLSKLHGVSFSRRSSQSSPQKPRSSPAQHHAMSKFCYRILKLDI